MWWRRTGLWKACVAGIGLLTGVLVVLGAAGCGDEQPLTELVVVVETDMDVPGTLETVTLTVTGPAGTAAYDETIDLREADAPDVPLTLSLTPGSEELAPVVIRARGSVAGGSTVEKLARTGFVEGERRMVVLWLRNACVDVTCPAEQTCGAGGGCVSAERPPESLPPWTGEPPADAGVPDGSPMDGGPMDAGTDASTPDGGQDAGIACSVTSPCPDIEQRDEGPCGNFSTTNECDETGTQQVDVTSLTCQDGFCVETTDTVTESCMRDTDDQPCTRDEPCAFITSGTCANGTCDIPEPCPDGCHCDTSSDVCMMDLEPTSLCPLQAPE